MDRLAHKKAVCKHLCDEIEADEGFEENAYDDTEGYLTIGIGFKISDPERLAHPELRPYALRERSSITYEEARVIVEEIVEGLYNPVSILFAPGRYQQFSIVQSAALLNMAYQMGVKGLSGFRKMIAHMEGGRYDKAEDEALDSLWAKQTKNRANKVAALLKSV